MNDEDWAAVREAGLTPAEFWEARYKEVVLQADGYLRVANSNAETAQDYEKAIRAALDELGVPDGNYPAPVANAWNILQGMLPESQESP